MSYGLGYGSPHVAPPVKPPWEAPTWLRISLFVVRIALVVFAVYTLLGIGKLFAFHRGMSAEESKRAMDDVAREFGISLLIPLDPLLIGIAVLSVVLYFVAKRLTYDREAAKSPMVISLICLGLSFFKISLIVPMMFASMSQLTSHSATGPSIKAPDIGEYSATSVALVPESRNFQVTGTVTNLSDYDWVSAVAVAEMVDKTGKACYSIDVPVGALAKGGSTPVATVGDHGVDLVIAKCVPVSASIKVTQFNWKPASK
ncbi:MAG TPA: hypothetical protein VFU07_05195 [Candidatus Lumbricidophila sp.]|nr:hypothetical protein [Candidatus Lumbricidophila sp.]